MRPIHPILVFLRASYPSASVDLTESSAGGVTIDIRFKDLFLVVQYSSRLGFGASLLRDDEQPPTGHDRAFADSAEVVDYLDRAMR